MLEEKDLRSDLQGRIKTLKSKFEELSEPPDRLDSSARRRWEANLLQADTLLEGLEEAVRELEENEKDERVRIDRTLQRLGIQARSMEKALQEGNKANSGHP